MKRARGSEPDFPASSEGRLGSIDASYRRRATLERPGPRLPAQPWVEREPLPRIGDLPTRAGRRCRYWALAFAAVFVAAFSFSQEARAGVPTFPEIDVNRQLVLLVHINGGEPDARRIPERLGSRTAFFDEASIRGGKRAPWLLPAPASVEDAARQSGRPGILCLGPSAPALDRSDRADRTGVLSLSPSGDAAARSREGEPLPAAWCMIP